MKQRIEDLKIYHTLCKVMSKTQAKCELMKVVHSVDWIEDSEHADKLYAAFPWSSSPQGCSFWVGVSSKLKQLEE